MPRDPLHTHAIVFTWPDNSISTALATWLLKTARPADEIGYVPGSTVASSRPSRPPGSSSATPPTAVNSSPANALTSPKRPSLPASPSSAQVGPTTRTVALATSSESPWDPPRSLLAPTRPFTYHIPFARFFAPPGGKEATPAATLDARSSRLVARGFSCHASRVTGHAT